MGLTRKLGISPQRVVFYDDMFRFQLGSRAASGEPTIDMDKFMQSIDKEQLAQVDIRLADVMRKLGVISEDGGVGSSCANGARREFQCRP